MIVAEFMQHFYKRKFTTKEKKHVNSGYALKYLERYGTLLNMETLKYLQNMTSNNALHNQSAIEDMISKEILTDENLIGIDANDVKNLKSNSDFIDGIVIDGKLDELGVLTSEAVNQIKKLHSDNLFVGFMLKIRVAEGCELMMEQLGSLHDVLDNLDEDVFAIWGIEMNAPVTDEIRICLGNDIPVD